MSSYFQALSFGQARPWLENKKHQMRLFTLKLVNVSNPLDAGAIWSQSTGGDRGMTDIKNNSDHRLHKALNSHRFKSMTYRDPDKKRGPMRRTYVFSDVVIWIPETYWRTAVINGGDDLLYMTEGFHYQHREVFSEDEFYQSRPPNYSIMPLAGLEDDEVICQFGMGVFLPNHDDEQTASMKLIKQGYDPYELDPWVFFKPAIDKDGKVIEPMRVNKIIRPVGLYGSQTMLLISSQLDNSSLQSPLWFDFSYRDIPPSPDTEDTEEEELNEDSKEKSKKESEKQPEKETDEGAIIINLSTNKAELHADNVYVKAITSQRSGKQTLCHFCSIQNNNDILTLVLDRNGVNSMVDALRNKPSPMGSGSHTIMDDDDGSDFGGFTHMDLDDEDHPDYLYELELTGIVLPKLGAFRNSARLSHYLLHLDKDGVPAQEKENIAWTIKGARNSDVLEWNTPKKPEWKKLLIDQPLPFPTDKSLYLQPAELTKTQYAILPIPEKTLSIPLSLEEGIIGRYQGKERTTADIPLSLLSQSSALIDINNRKSRTLGDIGLSGNHIKICLNGRKLSLEQTSRSKTHIVQKNGGIRLTLTAQQIYGEISPRESIILGPFQFQLVEDFLPEQMD